ncbi:MAG: dihydrolipoyl dehydrogenase, partial [Solirubrobacterales bacterium]
MTDGVFDVVVIGAGPGGYVTAIRARQLGLSTAVIEKDRVGGRCLNYACIPAKAVLRSADALDEVRKASTFGVALPEGVQPTVDFPTVAKRRDRVIKTMTGGVGGLLKKHEVTLVEGTATFAPPTADGVIEIHVSTAEGVKAVRAAHVVLATGSISLPVLGVPFGGRVVDTTGAWLATALPRSLAVVGAGASGVEVASAFGRLGTAVTLIEALPQILPAEEPEIAAVLAKELAKQNVELLAGAQLAAIEQNDAGVIVTVNGERREFDALCVAAGRAPDLAGMNVEAYGVATGERGEILVDDHQRTSNSRIFAIGDIVRGPALAHKASEEGVVSVETIAGHPDVEPIVVDNIPRATFCSPQVASIGLTEAQARATGRQIVVGEFPLAAAGAATVYGDRTGLVKIVGDAESGEILGAHAIGAKAADMIAELAVAKSGQVGYPDLARIIHAHPTISEAVLEAARAADGGVLHA